MKTNHILCMLIACILVTLPGIASNYEQPEAIIKKMNDQLTLVLKQPASDQGKNKDFSQIVEKVFMPNILPGEMVKSILGIRYWSQMKPKEQSMMIRAFKGMIIDSYASVVSNFTYKGHQIKIRPYRSKPGTSYMVLRTVLMLSNNDHHQINYTFYKAIDRWYIVDFTIDGISFVDNYRAQFKPVLDEGGALLLLEKLEARHESN